MLAYVTCHLTLTPCGYSHLLRLVVKHGVAAALVILALVQEVHLVTCLRVLGVIRIGPPLVFAQGGPLLPGRVRLFDRRQVGNRAYRGRVIERGPFERSAGRRT